MIPTLVIRTKHGDITPMIYATLFEMADRKPVRAGLIGTGTYGVSLLAQVQSIAGLDIPIICDQDVTAARKAWRAAGIAEEKITVCNSRSGSQKARQRGLNIITEDAGLMLESDLDVIVECTGHPEAAACHAEAAIGNGKHLVMVTKEADSVIGPRLQQLADEQGVVYTPADGDQHGLLIRMIGWVRQLGLEVICGGKARAYDYIYDEDQQVVRYANRSLRLPEGNTTILKKIRLPDTVQAMAERKSLLKDLPDAGAADLCESVIAANATGLVPDTPALHAPVIRISEIADVLCQQELGGVLGGKDKIDMIGCLRRPDEAGMNGGVFAVVSGKNKAAWNLLAEKGLTANHSRTCGVIYRPYHLLGVETPLSILCAGLLKATTGSISNHPGFDLVARTTRELKRGTIIRSQHEENDPMIRPLIYPSAAATGANPIPFYMAVNNRLNTDVPAGAILAANMIEAPAASRLWELRRELEKKFRL